jgi:hypothetical protein
VWAENNILGLGVPAYKGIGFIEEKQPTEGA